MRAMPIKVHLSRLLGERRMKVTDLAKKSRVSRPALHFLYHEQKKQISFDVLEKLCRALDVSVGDLLEYVPGDA